MTLQIQQAGSRRKPRRSWPATASRSPGGPGAGVRALCARAPASGAGLRRGAGPRPISSSTCTVGPCRCSRRPGRPSRSSSSPGKHRRITPSDNDHDPGPASPAGPDLASAYLCLVSPPPAGPAGKVDELARLLLERRRATRCGSRRRSCWAAWATPPASAPLAQALADSNKTVRWMAVQSLATHRPARRRARPEGPASAERTDGSVRAPGGKGARGAGHGPTARARRRGRIFLTSAASAAAPAARRVRRWRCCGWRSAGAGQAGHR